MARKVYKELEGLEIADIDHQGRGKALYDRRWFLIENTLPGEVVDAKIVRKDRGNYIARPYAFHKESPSRIVAPCMHFGVCGGCKWQNVTYAAQLEFKTKFVTDAFKTLPDGSYPEIKPIIGSDSQFYYRNKMEFSFASRKWLTVNEMQDAPQASMNGLGLHPAGGFDKVLDLQECLLQPEPSNSIRLWVNNFAKENGYIYFDLRNQHGFLRNLTIRTTTHTDGLMVIVSFFEENEPLRVKLLDALQEAFPAITSLHYVINGGKNDVIYEREVILYKGEPIMREKLGDLTFKIGPKSFFQVNIPQAKRLYDITMEMAGLNADNLDFPSKDHVVYDLYTGIGSIALYAARQCKQVIGIETIAEAIADAEENAKLNNITNCRFLAGDMKDILTTDFLNNNPQPDIIITDPPRAGMHPSVVQAILHANAPRIVYVSCNPVTQVRDLLPLLEKYKITAVQPVDMFPQTFHVECVVSLERR